MISLVVYFLIEGFEDQVTRGSSASSTRFGFSHDFFFGFGRICLVATCFFISQFPCDFART